MTARALGRTLGGAGACPIGVNLGGEGAASGVRIGRVSSELFRGGTPMATPSRPVYRPAPDPDADWWRLLGPLAALGIDLEASARAYGAFGRRRAVGSAAGLLRLVLGYALEGW